MVHNSASAAPLLGDRFLSGAGIGRTCCLPARVPNHWIKLVYPWVQILYPVLGARVWRNRSGAFPDSNSVLDKPLSASFVLLGCSSWLLRSCRQTLRLCFCAQALKTGFPGISGEFREAFKIPLLSLGLLHVKNQRIFGDSSIQNCHGNGHCSSEGEFPNKRSRFL